MTVNGEYSGTMEFRGLARPMHFQSARSDFRAEQIPGSVTLDLRDMKLDNVVGPVRFESQVRDIQAKDVTNSLELSLDRGDVQVTQTKTPLPKMDIHLRLNGDITLTVPEKAEFELEGRTEQGEVDNDFGSPLANHSDGHSATIAGTGGERSVDYAYDKARETSIRRN